MRVRDLDKHRPITIRESDGFIGLLSETGGVGRIVKGVNTTPDVGPGEISRQAKKIGFNTSKDGVPPVAKTNGIVLRTNAKKMGAGYSSHLK